MVFILFIIIVCGLLSFTKLKPQSYIYFFFLGILLAMYSGMRSTDADHDMYIYLYRNLKDAEVEPTFKAIVGLSKIVCDNEPIIMFILYAFLGVLLKLRAIAALSNFIFLSLAIYVSEYYILQEMTQIRAGVAGAFFLLSIRPLYNKDWLKFTCCCIFAILFHYSAVVMIALPLLDAKKINKYIWLLLIPSAYMFLSFVRYGLGYLLDLSLGSDKLDAYLFALSKGNETLINIFSPIQLIRIVIATFFILNCEKCVRHNQYTYLLIKCYIIGIISLVLFSSVDVIAFRISEIFLLVEIIVIPLLCFMIKPIKIGKIISLGYCMLLLIMMVSQKIIS